MSTTSIEAAATGRTRAAGDGAARGRRHSARSSTRSGESVAPSRRPRDSVRETSNLSAARQLLESCRYRGPAVAFDDIVGHDAAKRELAVVAEGFRRPEVATALGLTLVKGVVIIGPPGTGKSMLAKALASAVNRPVYIPPAAEMTPALLRQIYEALATEECVVIWDEVQSLISDFAESKLTAAFCTALDGVQASSGPITIGLTSLREAYLDEASLRSGRLTTKISLLLPNRRERAELWSRAIARVPVVGELDLDEAAEETVGMTGADIDATVSIALGLAMVDGTDALTMEALAEAIVRDNHVREEIPEPEPPADQWQQAIHEAGHAIYAAIANGPDTVFGVRLLDRGYSSPETATKFASDPARSASRADILSAVRVCFAGRVAEELVFGEDNVTLGVGHDLTRATRFLVSLADAGLLEGFPPVRPDVLEQSGGSEGMHSMLAAAVRVQADAALHDVRATLSGQASTITTFARQLHDHPQRALAGLELADALATSLAPELSVIH